MMKAILVLFGMKAPLNFRGSFMQNDRGFGFVTVDPEEPDYFINPTQTLSALNGDEVEVEMIAVGDPNDR